VGEWVKGQAVDKNRSLSEIKVISAGVRLERFKWVYGKDNKNVIKEIDAEQYNHYHYLVLPNSSIYKPLYCQGIKKM